MKKQVLILALLLTALLVGCSGEQPSESIPATTTEAEEQQTEQAALPQEDKEYAVGETWTVDGQWSVTVNSITETDYRNEFSDTNPSNVYMINYTYENIGYKDANGIMSGLYIDMESQIVGSDGNMGQSYPGEITNYPQETPIGAKCTGDACVGVNAPGTVKIYVEQYDGNGNLQKAVFSLTP